MVLRVLVPAAGGAGQARRQVVQPLFRLAHPVQRPAERGAGGHHVDALPGEGDPALDRGVDVLVRGDEGEGAVVELGLHLVERRQHGGHLALVEAAGPARENQYIEIHSSTAGRSRSGL